MLRSIKTRRCCTIDRMTDITMDRVTDITIDRLTDIFQVSDECRISYKLVQNLET